MPVPRRPLTVALVDDYEVVMVGVKHMFDSYRDRIEVAEIAAGDPIETPVDIALFDTFAQAEADHNDFDRALDNKFVRRTVIYSGVVRPDLVGAALEKGASGYLSKMLPAAALVDALERIHAGEIVTSDPTPKVVATGGFDWPGREEGLTERESEVVALITQGHSNADIARMTYLSINSIKTYIRGAYRKMGVSSRSHAVLWGVDHGFLPPGRRRSS